MADLVLGAGRPYSLVTTVIHRGTGHGHRAQIDLHVTTGDVRLRFFDRESLAHFCLALGDLARETFLPDRSDDRAVCTHVNTNHDITAGTAAAQLLIDDLFGPAFS